MAPNTSTSVLYHSSYPTQSAPTYHLVNSSINHVDKSHTTATIASKDHRIIRTHRVVSFSDMPSSSNYDSVHQQRRILEECSRRVEEQAYHMNRAMDNDENDDYDLSTVLERASFMLSELSGSHNDHHHYHFSSSQTFHSTSSYSSSYSSTDSEYYQNNFNDENDNYSSGSYLGLGSSSQLSPKNYFLLQTKIMDEMSKLEEFFLSLGVTEDENGTEVQDEASPHSFLMELYEVVQYCPHVIPRIYLQICVGIALVRSRSNIRENNSGKKAGTNDTILIIVKDLMDHIKSVQCPIRGLFLRNYVLQIFKYPIIEIEEDDGNKNDQTLKDCYTFLLQNFIKMNQFWVRLQNLPSSDSTTYNVLSVKKEWKRRETNRKDLRVLVGANFVRLSQLEGITPHMYKDHILPPILEEIVACKDSLAQSFLMDCIIQVFPDDFHIETLPLLLETLPKLHQNVPVRIIMEEMTERLKKSNNAGIIHSKADLFQCSLKSFRDQFFQMDLTLNVPTENDDTKRGEKANFQHLCKDCLPMIGDEIIGTRMSYQSNDVPATVHRLQCKHATRAINHTRKLENNELCKDMNSTNIGSSSSMKERNRKAHTRMRRQFTSSTSKVIRKQYPPEDVTVKVRWPEMSDAERENQSFLAELVVTSNDRKHLLADCGEVVSAIADIVKTTSMTIDAIATFEYLVRVKSTNHMQELMDGLKSLDSVLAVERRFGSKLL